MFVECIERGQVKVRDQVERDCRGEGEAGEEREGE